jgi:Carboxypeptidase regulatory-like domain
MNNRILVVLVALGVVAAGVVVFLMFQEPEPHKGPAVVGTPTPPKPVTPTSEAPPVPINAKPIEAGSIKPTSFNDTGMLPQDVGIGGFVQNEGGVKIEGATCELFEDTAAIKDRTQEGELRGKQVTTAEGMFIFEAHTLSLAERYVLKVSHPMYMTERKAIDLKKPDTLNVVLRLGTAMQGTVRTMAGQPIANATVMVFDMNQGALDPNGSVENFVMTDATGQYTIPHLAAGMKKVQASAQGFASVERSAIQIEQGKALAGIDFALNDGAGISGQVVATDGTPVIGAYVTARPLAIGKIQSPDAPPHDAREIQARREREVQMRASNTAPPPAAEPADVTGTEAPAPAPPPPVRGADEEVAKAERKMRTAELKESVVQQIQKDREALKDAASFKKMTAPTQPAGQTVLSVRTLPDGTFTVPGTEFGTYMVSVNGAGYIPPPQQTVSSPSTGILFTLAPNAHIMGTVIDDETRKPLGYFTLGLTQQPDEVLIPAHTKKAFGPPKFRDGTFDYIDVKPGRYWLIADAPGYAGGRSEEITVTQGEKKTGIEIRVVRGATIKGRVLDAKGGPVVGATVQPEPASLSGNGGAAGMFLSVMMQNMRRDIREAKTDSEGKYSLPNMLSGSYTIKVTHPEYGPQNTSAFSVGTSGEVNQPDIVMSRGASVRGRVKLADGTPDTKAMVQVAPVGGTPNFSGHRSAYTDADGRFEVTGLAVGQYRVIVAQRNGQPDLGTLFTNLKNPNTFALSEGEVKEMDL